MSVGNVDLASAWAVGREVANKLLATYYPDADATIDLVIFSKDKFDMLMPHGDYIGVNAVDDDECSEWLNNEAPASTLPPDYGVEELELNIDDYFGPTPNEPDHESCANIKHTLQYKGKIYYKSPLVAGLCSNHTKKFTMHTLRARGLALEDLQKQSEYVEVLNLEKEDLLKAGDLAAMLVRNEDKLVLAVIELTGFYGPANAVTQFSVDASSFFDPKSSITVLAQTLELNCTGTNPPASWQHLLALPSWSMPKYTLQGFDDIQWQENAWQVLALSFSACDGRQILFKALQYCPSHETVSMAQGTIYMVHVSGFSYGLWYLACFFLFLFTTLLFHKTWPIELPLHTPHTSLLHQVLP